MKLSRWDFRPARRSKYVVSPVKSGRPILRIIMLGALGLLVYLKFDDLVQSKLARSFSNPTKTWETIAAKWLQKGPNLQPERVPASIPPHLQTIWANDSTHFEVHCHLVPLTLCFENAARPDLKSLGFAKNLFFKTLSQWSLPPPSGMALVFEYLRDSVAEIPEDEAHDPNSGRWELAELRILSEGQSWRLVPGKTASGKASYCDGSRCLDDRFPVPPMAGYRLMPRRGIDSATELQFATAPAPGPAAKSEAAATKAVPIHPILPGLVMEDAASDSGMGWIKVYHGAELYSYYGHLPPFSGALAPGKRVDTHDTLALFPDSAVASTYLLLRVEKNGIAIDPAAFLELRIAAVPADAEAEAATGSKAGRTAHGR